MRDEMTSLTSLPTKNHRASAATTKNRDIVTLNVGGLRFQTRRSTLRRYPDTLLGRSYLLYIDHISF